MKRLLAWLRGLVRRSGAPPADRTVAGEKQHGVDLMYRSGDTHHLP